MDSNVKEERKEDQRTPAPAIFRRVTTHACPGLNEHVTIAVLDDPGPGGACHDYLLNLAAHGHDNDCRIRFQKGPIGEAGPNGVSNEALLAVVADRLAAFQAGPYACEENAQALNAIASAMLALQSRTRKRVERGVEGKSVI